MIKMKITGVDELTKLANDLKTIKKEFHTEGKWAIESLHKNITIAYERHIYDLVYDQYTPKVYERTYHLLGGHGAKDEQLQMGGFKKSYHFSIDEDSRDPVDGTTWREKADNIEHGAERMMIGFNRPFINETQQSLEWENKRIADEFEKHMRQVIDKAIRG